jgi:nitrogen fixation/metabolism regulation signal transduction histidine kinase
MKYRLENEEEKHAFKPSVSNVDTVYGNNLPLVELDEEQFVKALGYIFIYLMNNMDSNGKIQIASSIRQTEYYDKSIYITITGSGCRLSDVELQQLFDPFNVEDSNLIDVGPCIAQKIIEEHCGHLNVRQAKDDQTTFVVSLPVSS